VASSVPMVTDFCDHGNKPWSSIKKKVWRSRYFKKKNPVHPHKLKEINLHYKILVIWLKLTPARRRPHT